MNTYVVTVKFPRNPDHNPHDKKRGICPLTGRLCTDSTGAHHSTIARASSAEEAAAMFADHHITRVEEVS